MTIIIGKVGVSNHLTGGADNDVLYGGQLADTLDGGAGNDEFNPGSGADLIHGGAGNDQVWTGYGNDTVYGEDGNDWISGGDGRTTSLTKLSLYGGAGSDTIIAGLGADMVFGGNGRDRLFGDTGADHLYGGLGNDRLFGGKGNDTLSGGPGVDVLTGGAGTDTFVFGNDNRVTDYQSVDKIDLSAIDSNGTVAGDIAFVFGSTTIGGVSVDNNGTVTFVRLHVGDTSASDLVMTFDGVHTFTADSFIL